MELIEVSTILQINHDKNTRQNCVVTKKKIIVVNVNNLVTEIIIVFKRL